MERYNKDHNERHVITKIILLLKSHRLGRSHTIHAMAIKIATDVCPPQTRSSQPSLAPLVEAKIAYIMREDAFYHKSCSIMHNLLFFPHKKLVCIHLHLATLPS